MVLVTFYQENQAALSVSVSLPGTQGGDSHQTEGGLVLPREHFGTCTTGLCGAEQPPALQGLHLSSRLGPGGKLFQQHVLLQAPLVTNVYSCANQLC